MSSVIIIFDRGLLLDMEAREKFAFLSFSLLPCLLVFLLDDLDIILDDRRQSARCEKTFPEVVGLEAIRVGWIARTIVPALIEQEEPRVFPFQGGTHRYFAIIDRKVHDAALETEQQLFRVAAAEYCSIASSTVCLVRLFFSSKVATG